MISTAVSSSTGTPELVTTPPSIAVNPYGSGSGTLALNDPLKDNSLGYGWSEASYSFGSCQFTEGAYYATTTSSTEGIHCAANPDFSDFAAEVQMTIIQGDCGVLDFRLDSVNNTKYTFHICQDGDYDLVRAQGTTTAQVLAHPSVNSAVHQGLGQANIMAVFAKGSTIMLYVNHHLLVRVTDSTYSQGQIAFGASPRTNGGHPTQVAFSNTKVWTL